MENLLTTPSVARASLGDVPTGLLKRTATYCTLAHLGRCWPSTGRASAPDVTALKAALQARRILLAEGETEQRRTRRVDHHEGSCKVPAGAERPARSRKMREAGAPSPPHLCPASGPWLPKELNKTAGEALGRGLRSVRLLGRARILELETHCPSPLRCGARTPCVVPFWLKCLCSAPCLFLAPAKGRCSSVGPSRPRPNLEPCHKLCAHASSLCIRSHHSKQGVRSESIAAMQPARPLRLP